MNIKVHKACIATKLYMINVCATKLHHDLTQTGYRHPPQLYLYCIMVYGIGHELANNLADGMSFMVTSMGPIGLVPQH